MGESEEIVYRTREITNGDGLKQKPKKKEKPLIEGTSDEEMVERELQNAAGSKNGEAVKSYQPVKEKSIQEESDRETGELSQNSKLETTVREIQFSETKEEYINNFRVLGDIGLGGVSNVLLVEQPSTGARYAYKELNGERVRTVLNENPEAPKLLLDVLRGGARLTAKLGAKHPDKFPAFAIDYTYSDRPGILTQYVPHSLEERIGKLSEEDALKYVLQAAEEIKILHEDEKVVLADIKPSQFRIDDNGNLKLVDLDSKHSDPASITTTLIQSAVFSQIGRKSGVVGTPRYMAPEQWDLLEGKDAVIDERTDVFGLASMAYELITGEKPEGRHVAVKGKLASIDEIILKGRERKQKDRFESVDEFLKEINKVLGNEYKSEKAETLEEKAESTVPTSVPREMSSIFYKIGKGAVKAVLYSVGLSAAIPTLTRRIYENNKGDVSPVFIGPILSFGAAAIANEVYPIPIKETILAWLATNAASGVYEIYRHAKNKVKERKKEQRAGNYNLDIILEKIDEGDFGFLVSDNNLKTKEELSKKGARVLYNILKPWFKRRLDRDQANKRLVDNGVAIDESSAEKIMKKLSQYPNYIFPDTNLNFVESFGIYSLGKDKGYEIDVKRVESGSCGVD